MAVGDRDGAGGGRRWLLRLPADDGSFGSCGRRRSLASLADRGRGGSQESSNNRDDDISDDDETDGDDERQVRDDDGPSDSVYTILTGRPQNDPGGYEPPRYNIPQTYAGWKTVLAKTWEEYKGTFEGFRGGREEDGAAAPASADAAVAKGDGESNYVDDGADLGYELDEEALKRKQREVTDNLGRNLRTLNDAGSTLVETAKARTGITTKEDLRRWAGEQMKLMTECLTEFMSGYRESRDEEIDRMLNEYFKDLDDDEDEENDEEVNGKKGEGGVSAGEDTEAKVNATDGTGRSGPGAEPDGQFKAGGVRGDEDEALEQRGANKGGGEQSTEMKAGRRRRRRRSVHQE